MIKKTSSNKASIVVGDSESKDLVHLDEGSLADVLEESSFQEDSQNYAAYQNKKLGREKEEIESNRGQKPSSTVNALYKKALVNAAENSRVTQ